jgi:hypothetical protein
MRFMLQVRANADSEAGKMPSRELIAAMGAFNEQMIKAGVMLAGEGLQPSAKGARIVYGGGAPQLVEPPFAPPNELIAGFWIIQVASRDEAIAWAKRAPFQPGDAVEIRQIFEASDFPADVLPPEEAAKEQAWRDAQQAKAAPRAG